LLLGEGAAVPIINVKRLPKIQVMDLTRRSQNQELLKVNKVPVAVVQDDPQLTIRDLALIEHEVTFRSLRAKKKLKPAQR
jgi:hypothetical protein